MRAKIKNIPAYDRPREKLERLGAANLNDKDLMAVMLGKGTRQYDVLALADKVIDAMDKKQEDYLEEIKKIKGIGRAKAALISAAFEFVRRRLRPKGLKIRIPADAVSLVKHYADRKQEHFVCISLNGAKEVITVRLISIGLVDKALVHPREVFADPIIERASSIIIAHNHPFGDLLPSSEDVRVTNILIAAAKVLGIKLYDHLIFNAHGYYSFLENGLISLDDINHSF